MLYQNRRYAVVPESKTIASRNVYATVCGYEGQRRIAVPQNQIYDGRVVDAMAGCLDGQLLEDWRVTGVPQNQVFQDRSVYAFSCCPLLIPGTSSSSSSSSSSSGSSSSSPMSSSFSGGSTSGTGGSGAASGSGSGPVIIDCGTCGITETIYATISNVSGCACMAGTYPLIYTGDGNKWISPSLLEICVCNNTIPGYVGIQLGFYCSNPDCGGTFGFSLQCLNQAVVCAGVTTISCWPNLLLTYGPIALSSTNGFCDGSINVTITS